jgi:hypothetical protein
MRFFGYDIGREWGNAHCGVSPHAPLKKLFGKSFLRIFKNFKKYNYLYPKIPPKKT